MKAVRKPVKLLLSLLAYLLFMSFLGCKEDNLLSINPFYKSDTFARLDQ